MSELTVQDRFVSVQYLRVELSPTQGAQAGGSGMVRMWLSELPEWLARQPGVVMIVSIKFV